MGLRLGVDGGGDWNVDDVRCDSSATFSMVWFPLAALERDFSS